MEVDNLWEKDEVLELICLVKKKLESLAQTSEIQRGLENVTWKLMI